MMRNRPTLHKLFDSGDIARMVENLALRISDDYRNKNPIVVGVLKGSFIFLADLVRELDIEFRIDFIRISSYRSGENNGQISLINDFSEEIEGRDVIIIEDIVDTGNSLKYLNEHLFVNNPTSIKCCALIDKRERRECEVRVDYPGFVIKKGYVIGYGMDYNGWGRNFGDIYVINSEKE